MDSPTSFTISYGDKPEDMDVVLDLMRELGAIMEVEIIKSGEEIYSRGVREGVEDDIYTSLKRTKLLFKNYTHTPKDDAFIPVSRAINEKLGLFALIEYLVGKKSPGVGLVIETSAHPITPQIIEESYLAALRLGGRSIAYTIDELGLMFEKLSDKYRGLKAKYIKPEEIATPLITDFDLVFTDVNTAAEIKKFIDTKYGANIFLGNGYTFFEPMEEYYDNSTSIMLAAAMLLKFIGQNEAAWAVYEKLEV